MRGIYHTIFVSIFHHQVFIGNEWHESCSGRKIPVYNPTTEKLLCEVEEADSVSILHVASKLDELYKKNFECLWSIIMNYIVSTFLYNV